MDQNGIETYLKWLLGQFDTPEVTKFYEKREEEEEEKKEEEDDDSGKEESIRIWVLS